MGDTVHGYELIELIGSGGFADVWKARDPARNDRIVALKILRDPAQVSRLLLEARAQAANYLHIVQVYDVLLGNPPALVLEYFKGGSLRNLLRERGRLPIDEVVSIAVQVARALANTHDRGFVHGDLKPENILTMGSPPFARCAVSDFGLGRAITEIHDSRGISAYGTREYMAPEQRGGALPSKASDVFQLGLLFQELATGGPSPVVLDELGARGASKEVVATIAACLRRDPEDRPRADVVLAQLLRAFSASSEDEHVGEDEPRPSQGAVRYDPANDMGRWSLSPEGHEAMYGWPRRVCAGGEAAARIERDVSGYDQRLALDLDRPERHWVLYCRGRAHAACGNDAAALRDFTEALCVQPGHMLGDRWNYVKAVHNAGIARLNLGDVLGALADFDTSVAWESTYEGYLLRGECKRRLRFWKGAAQDFGMARRRHSCSGSPEESVLESRMRECLGHSRWFRRILPRCLRQILPVWTQCERSLCRCAPDESVDGTERLWRAKDRALKARAIFRSSGLG